MWIEDQVYDDVNDYYRYLASGSPISDPHLPLDDGGSPSYAENVLEHWIEARLGVAGIQDYWERRRAMPGEDVLLSYDAILTQGYAPLDSAFVDFALFNLQTGVLAAPGSGYPEAAGYPDARLALTVSTLPAALGSAVEHLAAKFYRIEGFSAEDERVQLRLRQPEGLNLQLAALTVRKDGVRIERSLPMSSAEASFRLDRQREAADIEELYLVVANGNASGPAEWFFANVEEVPAATPASGHRRWTARGIRCCSPWARRRTCRSASTTTVRSRVHRSSLHRQSDRTGGGGPRHRESPPCRSTSFTTCPGRASDLSVGSSMGDRAGIHRGCGDHARSARGDAWSVAETS